MIDNNGQTIGTYVSISYNTPEDEYRRMMHWVCENHAITDVTTGVGSNIIWYAPYTIWFLDMEDIIAFKLAFGGKELTLRNSIELVP